MSVIENLREWIRAIKSYGADVTIGVDDGNSESGESGDPNTDAGTDTDSGDGPDDNSGDGDGDGRWSDVMEKDEWHVNECVSTDWNRDADETIEVNSTREV
jgi:hypothetical protein